MAATRPSIISEGATMSAPAWAWERAVLARYLQGLVVVHRLAVYRMPQWPWEVYSHMHTSVIR